MSTPSETPAKTKTAGASQALSLFHDAARRVPAYRDFLATNHLNPARIKTADDFVKVPPVNKDNYFSRYSLSQLSWDGVLNPRLVSMSSGSTGQAYFWPRASQQVQVVSDIFERLYRDLFKTDQRRTLVITCFGLGAWIAGLENYLATYAAAGNQRISLFAAGLEQAEALRAVQKLSADFDQTIICGYPPFMKDTLEAGAAHGIDWPKLNVRLLTAGEAISEAWRAAVLQLLGQTESTAIINYYGMAEAGTIAHETGATIALRQRLEAGGAQLAPQLFSDSGVAALYQYYPDSHYFESQDQQLLLTYSAGLPLVRYQTGDHGGVLDFGAAQDLAEGQLPADWDSPMVYLFGRKNLSATLYAVNIYPENIKAALEDGSVSQYVSGKFQIATKNTRSQDQYLEVRVELKSATTPAGDLGRQIQGLVIQKLLELNSEYAKLRGAVGTKANPRIKLVKPGALGFVAGKKHRWVKPD